MLAGIGPALVHGLTDVGPVVQQLVDIALVDRLAALGGDALGTEHLRHPGAGTGLDEALENAPHPPRLRLADHELTITNRISQGHLPAHPHAARPRGRE